MGKWAAASHATTVKEFGIAKGSVFDII